MKVQIRNINNISIIDCSGDVDLYSSTRLRQALLGELGRAQAGVLVNMTDVSYIDSSGIATLVEGLQLSRQNKKRFGLFGLRSNARAVLELARLHKVFTLFATEPEAMEKILTTEPFGGI